MILVKVAVGLQRAREMINHSETKSAVLLVFHMAKTFCHYLFTKMVSFFLKLFIHN